MLQRETASDGKPTAEMLARQAEEKRQLTIQQEHILRQQILRGESPSGPGGEAKPPAGAHHPAPGRYPATTAPPPTTSSGGGGVKQEPTLNLYGYQPFPHAYISQEKLHSHLKDEKVKEEGKAVVPQPPPAHQGHGAVKMPPQPGHHQHPAAQALVKDHAGRTVIVDNRTKDEPIALQRYPQPAHEGHHHHPQNLAVQQGSITLGSPKAHLKGGAGAGQEPRPAHTGHPGQFKGRTQSPHGGAPPTPAHQDHKSGGPPPPPAPPATRPPPHAHAGGSMLTVTQPPSVAISAAAAYSYNLIQQGLVPNPIYQQATTALAQGGGSSNGGSSSSKPGHPAPAHGAPSHPAGSHPSSTTSPSAVPVAGHKRRNSKDLGTDSQQSKRPKTGVSSATPAGPNIPVTSGTHAHGHSAQAPAHTTASSAAASTSSPAAQTTSPPGKPAGAYLTASTAGGFMESFRTFVENTVQSAFYSSDSAEGSKQHPKGRHKEFLQQQQASQQSSGRQHPPAPPSKVTPVSTSSNAVATTTATPPPSASPASSVSPPADTNATSAGGVLSSSGVLPLVSSGGSSNAASGLPAHLTTNVARVAPAASPGGASISSTSSIMETINRVANGFLDTDSDTLSAPSPPPPHLKSDGVTPSPLKSSNHTKGFKKAWLQRYSDEDKTDGSVTGSSSGGHRKKASSLCGSEAGSDCYTFTGKEEEKVPPKFSQIKQEMMMDESTTSASEAESQVSCVTSGCGLPVCERDVFTLMCLRQ